MNGKQERTVVGPAAMLIAAVIVGLWLLIFWLGYGVGKDVGHAIFGGAA